MSGKNDDGEVGLLEGIIIRIVVAVLTMFLMSFLRNMFFAAPEVGNVVAVASFGDDGLYIYWDCKDATGVYPCQNNSIGDDPTNRKYYFIPAQYEVIDTVGGVLTSDKEFILESNATFYRAKVGFNEADFQILEEINPAGNTAATLVSAAEGGFGVTWWYYVYDGQLLLYKDGEFSEVEIASNLTFLETSMFTNQFNPTLWCRAPDETIVVCTGPTELTNFVQLPYIAWSTILFWVIGLGVWVAGGNIAIAVVKNRRKKAI